MLKSRKVVVIALQLLASVVVKLAAHWFNPDLAAGLNGLFLSWLPVAAAVVMAIAAGDAAAHHAGVHNHATLERRWSNTLQALWRSKEFRYLLVYNLATTTIFIGGHFSPEWTSDIEALVGGACLLAVTLIGGNILELRAALAAAGIDEPTMDFGLPFDADVVPEEEQEAFYETLSGPGESL